MRIPDVALAGPWPPGASAASLAEQLTLSASGTGLRCAGEELSITEGTSEESVRRQVAGWLYAVLHAGHPALVEVQPLALPDREFHEEIEVQVPDPGATVPVTVLARRPGRWPPSSSESEPDGSERLAVLLQGLRVSVPAHEVMVGSVASGAAGDAASGMRGRARIPAYRPNLTPGFLMLASGEGDGGGKGEGSGVPHAGTGGIDPGGIQWRHYLAARCPEAATRLWEAVIPALLDTPHRFQAKVLSRADHYPRADAIVVYSTGTDTVQVEHTVIEALRARPDVQDLLAGAPHSLWCELHPTGLQRAVAPSVPRGRPVQSFGQHRSEAIAEAVMDHRDDPATAWAEILRRHLVAAGIDPRNLARGTGTSEVPPRSPAVPTESPACPA